MTDSRRLQAIANDARRMQNKFEEGECDTDDLLCFVDNIVNQLSDLPFENEEEEDDEDEDEDEPGIGEN